MDVKFGKSRGSSSIVEGGNVDVVEIEDGTTDRVDVVDGMLYVIAIEDGTTDRVVDCRRCNISCI